MLAKATLLAECLAGVPPGLLSSAKEEEEEEDKMRFKLLDTYWFWGIAELLAQLGAPRAVVPEPGACGNGLFEGKTSSCSTEASRHCRVHAPPVG